MAINSDRYKQTCDMNAEVLSLIEQYRSSPVKELREKIIGQIFAHLLPITRQVILLVQGKLKLPKADRADMLQEAYLKLFQAISSFSKDYCPVFVAFWRRALHNHLMSLYYPMARMLKTSFTTDIPARHISNTDRIVLEELLREYLLRFDGFPIALSILRQRIFTLDPITQGELALAYAVTQGLVSKWEVWLRQTIKADHPDIL